MNAWLRDEVAVAKWLVLFIILDTVRPYTTNLLRALIVLGMTALLVVGIAEVVRSSVQLFQLRRQGRTK